jgi:hypothetical protein
MDKLMKMQTIFETSLLHVLYCTYSVTLLGAGTRCGPPGTAILSASCPASPGAYSTSLSASSAMMPGSTMVTGWSLCSIGSVCFGASRIRIRISNYLCRSVNKQKIKINQISSALWLLNDMLSLNTNVNVPKVRKTQKNFVKTFFCWRRERGEGSGEGSGAGSIPKCHGSGTLVNANMFYDAFMCFYFESFIGTHYVVYAVKQN